MKTGFDWTSDWEAKIDWTGRESISIIKRDAFLLTHLRADENNYHCGHPTAETLQLLSGTHLVR